MQPYPYKSWLRRQVELGALTLVVIVMLPAIVVMLNTLLRPLLVVIGIVIVLLIAVRGTAGYVQQKRERW